MFAEDFGDVPHVQSTTESSSNHLAYDVLNRRFVRSDRGVPIQLPHLTPVNEVREDPNADVRYVSRPVAFGDDAGDPTSSGRRASNQRASVPTTSSTSEEHHIPSMFPRFPLEYRNDRRTVQGTTRSYPEFDELMQMYHRNVFEYNRTTQSFIGEISLNPSRSSQSIREISNIYHSFNQNMQEYHRITDNFLDLLRDMYFSQNSHNSYSDVNTGIRSDNRNRTDVGVGHNTNPPSTFASRTNTTTTISPPRTLFSYTLFPYVGQGLDQRVVRETPSLLTTQQLTEFTEEYTYSSDHVQTVVPVCPISLEDFQEGESITRIRECLHEFKTPHLNRWFLRSSRCPVCRWNLLSPPTTRSNRSRSNSQLIVQNTSIVPGSDQYEGSMVQGTSVPGSLQPENSRGHSLYEFVDTSGSATTISSRLQEILADPSLNHLSQRLFSNIFQNMLMNTTDAPPNITNRGSTEDSLNIQSLFGGGAESFINSIDITYTIDYDSSSDALQHDEVVSTASSTNATVLLTSASGSEG